MSNPTTDLAARFEAKREEYLREAQSRRDESAHGFLAQSLAFAEARDMARVGAAGGADGFVLVPKRATKAMLDAAYAAHDAYEAAETGGWGGIGSAYEAMVKAAPPPPAQQGSSSPPLTAERVDLRELEPCSEAEIAAWEAWATGRGYDMHEHPLHYLFLDTKTDMARQGWKAGLAWAREQVAASLPGGTGSADEGMCASSGPDHSAEPEPANGLGPTGECSSRGPAAADPSLPFKEVLLEAYGWLVDADGYLWGLTAGDMGYDQTDMRLVDLFDLAIEAEWHRFKITGEKKWPVHEITLEFISTLAAALGIEARQGRDEGSVEDESPAPQGATPTPDPVGQAKALLEGLDPTLTAEQHVIELRRLAARSFAFMKLKYLTRADAIEAALATIHASQDQAGEVRDDA